MRLSPPSPYCSKETLGLGAVGLDDGITCVMVPSWGHRFGDGSRWRDPWLVVRLALQPSLPCLTGAPIWVAKAWRRCVAAGSDDPSLWCGVAEVVRGGSAGDVGRRCGWPGHGCSIVLLAADRGHGGAVMVCGVLSGGRWPCPDLPPINTCVRGMGSPEHLQCGISAVPSSLASLIYDLRHTCIDGWSWLRRRLLVAGLA